jgi:hypothetical protein
MGGRAQRRPSFPCGPRHDRQIATVVPEHLRPFIAEPSVAMKPSLGTSDEWIDTSSLQKAFRKSLKVRLCYRSESGKETDRTVWPAILVVCGGIGPQRETIADISDFTSFNRSSPDLCDTVSTNTGQPDHQADELDPLQRRRISLVPI